MPARQPVSPHGFAATSLGCQTIPAFLDMLTRVDAEAAFQLNSEGGEGIIMICVAGGPSTVACWSFVVIHASLVDPRPQRCSSFSDPQARKDHCFHSFKDLEASSGCILRRNDEAAGCKTPWGLFCALGWSEYSHDPISSKLMDHEYYIRKRILCAPARDVNKVHAPCVCGII